MCAGEDIHTTSSCFYIFFWLLKSYSSFFSSGIFYGDSHVRYHFISVLLTYLLSFKWREVVYFVKLFEAWIVVCFFRVYDFSSKNCVSVFTNFRTKVVCQNLQFFFVKKNTTNWIIKYFITTVWIRYRVLNTLKSFTNFSNLSHLIVNNMYVN